MTDKFITGQRGEQAVVDWLRQHGFMIVERNWREAYREIDIIATRYGVLHFVEVKSRRVGSLQSGEEAVDSAKCRTLRRVAQSYMRQHRIYGDVQFDVAAVDVAADGTCDVRYIERAIEYGW